MAAKYLTIIFAISFHAIALAQDTPEEHFVKTFSESKNKWLIRKNTDSLKTMLDHRCLYLHSNGWIQNAEEVISDLETGKLVYKHIEISESQARQFESMVIVNGKGRFTGMVENKPFDLQLAFTEVYIKRKESWKLVSRHSNKIDP